MCAAQEYSNASIHFTLKVYVFGCMLMLHIVNEFVLFQKFLLHYNPLHIQIHT